MSSPYDLVAVNFGNGQAAAVMGNRRTGFNALKHIFRQLNNMSTEIRFFINGHDFGSALHNTSKHAYNSCFFRTVMTPFNPSTITVGKTGCQQSAFSGDFFTR